MCAKNPIIGIIVRGEHPEIGKKRQLQYPKIGKNLTGPVFVLFLIQRL